MIRNQLQLFEPENVPILLEHNDKKYDQVWLLRSNDNDVDFVKIDSEKDNRFWAYHAGMFDGDGGVYFRNVNNLSVVLGLKDRKPVEELANLYKGLFKYATFKNKKHKPHYRVEFRGNKALHFLLKVCPYLIEDKQKTIDIIREYIPKYIPRKISAADRFFYIPGYFDAEGSFKIKKIQRRTPEKIYDNIGCVCKFTSTNLNVLEYLKKYISHYLKIPIEDLHICKTVKDRKKTRYDLYVNKFDNQHFFGNMFLDLLKIDRKVTHIKKLNHFRYVMFLMAKPFGNINFKDKNTRDKYYNA